MDIFSKVVLLWSRIYCLTAYIDGLGNSPLQEYALPYQVILIGDCRVGKTSFLQSVINNRSISNSQNVPPTIGVEYAPTKVKIRGQ